MRGEGIKVGNQKLQNFIDLVTFDQNIITLETSILNSEKKVQRLRDESQKIQKKLEDKKNELKKNFDLQELHVKDLQEKENEQVVAMERLTNNKECDAASKQLDHIRAERTRCEKKLMHTWNAYQMLEKEVEQLCIDYDHNIVDIQNEIVKEDVACKVLQQELQEKIGQRNLKIRLLPEELMSSYENMRGKVINPVVPVSQDSCSACFYLVSSRDLQTLRQNGLLSCKDCYRFLYFEDTAQDKESK